MSTDDHFHRPAAWADLTATNIDLGDMLGTPGVRRAPAEDRAVGAFESPTRAFGPSGTTQLLAHRPLELGVTRRGVVLAAQQTAARLLPREAHGDQADLRKVHELRSAAGTHVVLQQQFQGHDVVGGRVQVHLDASGAYGFTGKPIGDLAGRTAPPMPTTDLRRVRDVIRQRYPVPRGTRLTPRLVAMPVEGRCRWAWFTKVALEDPVLDLRLFLDGDTLEPLLSYPASVAAFGEAHAYRTNPRREPAPARVVLRGLLDEPGDALRAANVTVIAGAGEPWTSSTRDFRTAPDDARFDQAAAYHNVTAALRYFAGLGRPGLLDPKEFRPITVVVNDPGSSNNAYYHPEQNLITLGEFLAVADGGASARSADMVVHEVGHAVVHAISRLGDTPAELPRALNEGYSDYFACSFLDDPRFGDYVQQQETGARNCADPSAIAKEPLSQYGDYALGEIWANVLWAIREEVGPAVGDALAFESLYFAQTLTSAEEGLGVLHMADAALFPTAHGTAGIGRHADVIAAAFGQRFP